MALLRKFFHKKPPDGLLEISDRVYVFDCCLSTNIWEDEEYGIYIESIVGKLRGQFHDASFMVFEFCEEESRNQLGNILMKYDMTVMDYPHHYEGCPLLTMEMIHHFLRSSENWLSLSSRNILLMHCGQDGWPVLAFMLASLLIYRKQFSEEQKTLDMIYKLAPRELLQSISPLNPLSSQLRYLRYVSRRNNGSEWPPLEHACTLDCILLRSIPDFDDEGGCRPIIRIYGQDPFMPTDLTSKVLFSMPKRSKSVLCYTTADCEVAKIDIHCLIQGDVVLECISLDSEYEREEMMFRVMFNTSFLKSNILTLDRDNIDVLWNSIDRFPKDFRAEVMFSEMEASGNNLGLIGKPHMEELDGLPVEAFAKVRDFFGEIEWLDPKSDVAMNVYHQITAANILQESLEWGSPLSPSQSLLESALEKVKEKTELIIAENVKENSPFSREKQSLSRYHTSPTRNDDFEENEANLSYPAPPLLTPPPPLKHSIAASPLPPTPTPPPPPPPPYRSSAVSGALPAPPVPPPVPKPLLRSNNGGCNGSIPPVPGLPFGLKEGGLSRNNLRGQCQTKKTNLKPYHWLKLTRIVQGSLWAEAQKPDEAEKAPEFDISELEKLFSAAAPPGSDTDGKGGISGRRPSRSKSEKVQLIELRRAYNCEIMLSKVKIPLPDLMCSILALDESVLDVDQVDNLIKFCPTKEEIDLLKGYTGDIDKLGRCEQFFLELLKVPRVESKLRVLSFKLQFSQVSDLRTSLSIINSAANEVRDSIKLRRIMQTILSLGNALNHGTARGSALGFRLDSLLKLSDTRSRNNKMTLMHYLCKVLAEKLPELLDFPKDLKSLEAASKIQLKYLAEEMQGITKGFEKVVQELNASEHDGPISENFHKNLKEFLGYAEGEVRSLASLYSTVGRSADALALYFGEDPARVPFEQVVSTLLNFAKMFVRSHEENCKQLEFEKKKLQKEEERERLNRKR